MFLNIFLTWKTPASCRSYRQSWQSCPKYCLGQQDMRKVCVVGISAYNFSIEEQNRIPQNSSLPCRILYQEDIDGPESKILSTSFSPPVCWLNFSPKRTFRNWNYSPTRQVKEIRTAVTECQQQHLESSHSLSSLLKTLQSLPGLCPGGREPTQEG